LSPIPQKAVEYMFYPTLKFLKTLFAIITDSILQAENRVRLFARFCRERLVSTHNRRVIEYPSKCLAVDRSTLRSNSSRLNKLRLIALAKQWFSFPNLNQAIVAITKGLQDLRLVGFIRLKTLLAKGGNV